MKKMIVSICSLAVFLTLFAGLSLPITASAQVSGDFEYVLSSYWDNDLNMEVDCVKITGYTGKAADLIIPNTIGGYPVTYIDEWVFDDRKTLTSVVIPDSVISIGMEAFSGCTMLVDITFPKSIQSIGNRAFVGCDSLTSVTFPEGVEFVWFGDSAFVGCDSLESVYIADITTWCTSVFESSDSNPLYYAAKLYLNGEIVTKLVIPDNVIYLNDYAFYGCSSLISVTFPDGVESIGEKTFAHCSSLATVSFPDSLTCIKEYAFDECSSLSAVYIHDVTAWCSLVLENALSNPLYYARNLYLNGELITDLSIPEGVTHINDYAFYNCVSLTSVAIPKSLESLGWEVFYACDSLNAVYITDLKAWCEIEYYDKYYAPLMVYARNLYLNGKLVTDLVIPEGVTRIHEDAFRCCESLKTITIPESVTIIDKNAYDGWISLEAVYVAQGNTVYSDINGVLFSKDQTTLLYYPDRRAAASYIVPEGVTQIGTAFSENEILEHIVLPVSVTYIGERAFMSCSSLKSITIPITVTSIGDAAFYLGYNGNFQNVYYSGTKAQWKLISIKDDNDQLTSACIHYNVTEDDIADHWQLQTVQWEPSCEWDGEATYTCDCGYEATRAIPATGHTLRYIETIAPTCTQWGYALYECTTCWEMVAEDHIPGGHTFENNVCVNCDGAVEECLTSAHKYASNTYQSWYVRQEGAKSISLTFSPDTEVEEDCDYLYIYDSEGELFGEYTGTELAGKQITVPGDFVEIMLVSDESMNYYGFAVTDVCANYGVRGDIDGDGVADLRDLTAVFYHVNAIGKLTEEGRITADINKDGKVNLADVARLFYIVNELL